MFTKINQQGFTLIEIIMFLVILSTALGGVTLLFIQTGKSNVDPMIRQKAITIAYAYLDEISKQRWNENTPAGGGKIISSAPIGIDSDEARRENYDDIDDYHRLRGQAEDKDGTDISEYDGFNVYVSVRQTNNGANWNNIPHEDTREIKVTVNTPTGESFAFVVYRVNF